MEAKNAVADILENYYKDIIPVGIYEMATECYKAGIKEVVETYKRENPCDYKKYEEWWKLKIEKWGIK